MQRDKLIVGKSSLSEAFLFLYFLCVLLYQESGGQRPGQTSHSHTQNATKAAKAITANDARRLARIAN